MIVAGAPVEAGSGATYVFQRTENDPWRQTTLAHSSEAQAYDNFGDSAAISGDVLVVGAYSEDYGPGDAIPGAGTVYVFQRDQGGAGNWGRFLRSCATLTLKKGAISARRWRFLEM